MKKILLLLVFVLASFGLSAKVVRPIKYNWTVNHIPDGEYLVGVDWETAKTAKDGCYLTFEIFLPDRYTASMMNDLAVGDSIIVNDKIIKIVNKRLEDDLYVFKEEDDTEIYFTDRYNGGYFTHFREPSGPWWFYNSHGKVTLKVIKFHATFCHDEKCYVKGAGIATFIKRNRKKQHFRFLNWHNITVKKGKVVLLKSYCGE